MIAMTIQPPAPQALSDLAGLAAFLSDPAAAVQACNGGGLSEFDLDAHMQTTAALRG